MIVKFIILAIKIFFFILMLHSGMIIQAIAKDDVSIQWEYSYATALKKSVDQNKPVVIYLYLEGCNNCHDMDVEIFTHPELIKFSRNQVYTRLKVEEGTVGYELSKKYNIDKYPTLLIINGNEKEIGRIYSSSLHPDDYASLICSYLTHNSKEAGFSDCTVSKAQDIKRFFLYGKQQYESMEFKHATMVFEHIVVIDPKNKYGTTDKALHLLGVCHIYLGNPKKGANFLRQLLKKFPESLAISDASFILGNVCAQQGRTTEAKRLFQTLIEKYPKHIFAADARKALIEMEPGFSGQK